MDVFILIDAENQSGTVVPNSFFKVSVLTILAKVHGEMGLMPLPPVCDGPQPVPPPIGQIFLPSL